MSKPRLHQGKKAPVQKRRSVLPGRRKADFALFFSEARYRALFRDNPTMIFTIDTDGTILAANPFAASRMGYATDELEGRSVLSLFHEDDRAAVSEQLLRCLKDPSQVHHWQFRKVSKDGEILWVEETAQAIYDLNGALNVLVVCHDVTESRRAERELAEKQLLLEEANLHLEQRVAAAVTDLRKKDRILIQQGRQAAMGEMIGHIAHQWRQPLNTLGLIVQELQLTYGRDEFSKESLDASVRKAMGLISHMSKTIEDFRNYFRPEKEKTLFNVNQAIARTLSLVEPSLKNLDIHIELVEKHDTELSGYANEYSQVLLNILINCKDAFEEGRVDRQPVIVITVSKEGNRSVVTVSDNAGGIPESVIDKIFDPYFTTKNHKGTGIGLFMAKTIIEKNMGGRLTVRNTAEGAEFRIEV